MARRKNAFDKRIGVSGVLVALSVIILYLGCAIEVLDLTMSAIVSLMVMVIVIELGYGYAWLTYLATAILSILLLPQKTPAIFYACFMGFYPIIKAKLERLKSRAAQWVIKEIVFNVCLVVLMLLSRYLLYLDSDGLFVFEAVFFILANGTFVLYDIALTRLISLYIFKLRKKFKIK